MSELTTKYQKKTDREHVLDNPDTYTGSMQMTDYNTYVYDDISQRILYKELNIIPGLYKLFDEGVVNCRDHSVRQSQNVIKQVPNTIPVSRIDFSISTDGTITMTNDGNGIDIELHPEYGIWIPEMIFGHLRTSTNYDKTEEKIVGGKNGFGFKLVLIWSSWGRIETIDHIRGLKYTQEFTENLSHIHKPTITKCNKKPYTTVSFKPDYTRLGISGLTPDMLSLFKRRVYDIAAITDKKITVRLNGEPLNVKQFMHYVDLYIGTKEETIRVYETNDRWEIVACMAPAQEFTQVSFVNGIFTSKGGKHVDYILNQIVRKMIHYISKKKKIDVKATTIKEQLMLFIRCDIVNPMFDSQTKDYMTTPQSNFGSSCEISEKLIEKLARMGVMDNACALTGIKELKASKKTDGTKTKTIRGIPKLVDANDAGTAKSSECTLLLVEGDSAKAGVVSGLSKEDRRIYGVYPLKGKLMNVRGAPTKTITSNHEITDIKQILGLETGKSYTIDTIGLHLRYGRVLFLTDQDLDGTHIKGLCINLFDTEWSSLIGLSNFIGFMHTPILKAKKGNQELLFYNNGEYDVWKQQNEETNWKIKYYKGLGTSTAKEFQEYFKNQKVVMFHCEVDCRDAIDMVFNKKRSNDRKVWLEHYERNDFMNTSLNTVLYKEFITKEMIHFSKYDCDRSIPNVMDGLKTSLRKILYAAFKRNLVTEIKVAQFSGYVSEHSAYHHGEASLNGAIVGMAQDFVGSNNIHLLNPNGQFGTRLQGGKDAASERYIFTELNALTRLIFQASDDNVVTYLDDDNTPVEPIWYAPILPMLLVNGSKGIGTGFSTDIPSFNPMDIIQYIVDILHGRTSKVDFIPYYKGFKGTVSRIDPHKYLIKGQYTVLHKTVRIHELPIGTWTDDYKMFLEQLMVGDGKPKDQLYIKEYLDMCTDKDIDLTITFYRETDIQTLLNTPCEHQCNGLEKLLHLYTTQTTTNMHAFDEKEQLKKFDTPYDILDHYMNVRREVYVKRKDYLLKELNHDLSKLSNKARFITEILQDTIDLRNKSNTDVVQMLAMNDYTKMNNHYDYLIKLPMNSVTQENVSSLLKDKQIKTSLKDTLFSTTIEDMWLSELQILQSSLARDTVKSIKIKKK